MNLIKEIDPGSADKMNVIIEINKGSKNKYEIDKETGLIMLDRAMYTTQDYPFDYGFVPQTLWDDGDPLDVLVLTTYPLFPGVLVKVRPVAVVNMVDDGESDAKIIAVPAKDPRWDDVKDLKDVNKHTIKEIEHFYKTYKNLQDKVVEINGIDGRDKAMEAFERAREMKDIFLTPYNPKDTEPKLYKLWKASRICY
jgi:inorganic pyrophosphatase